MFPVDNEFITLYLAYAVWLLLLLSGYFFSRHRRRYRQHLVAYGIYTAVMLYIFADKQHFQYGSSLLVLLAGAAFFLLHLLTFIIQAIYLFFAGRNAPGAPHINTRK